MEADLADLEARYAEHCRRFNPAWLHYGEHDPLVVSAALLFPDLTGHVLDVHPAPGPGRVARATWPNTNLQIAFDWASVLAWNESERSQFPPWRDLPFFHLSDLTPVQARLKLSELRSHLELRSRLYKMRWMSGQPVGSLFLARLKAYRQWCSLSQTVLRAQEPDVFQRAHSITRRQLAA